VVDAGRFARLAAAGGGCGGALRCSTGVSLAGSAAARSESDPAPPPFSAGCCCFAAERIIGIATIACVRGGSGAGAGGGAGAADGSGAGRGRACAIRTSGATGALVLPSAATTRRAPTTPESAAPVHTIHSGERARTGVRCVASRSAEPPLFSAAPASATMSSSCCRCICSTAASMPAVHLKSAAVSCDPSDSHPGSGREGSDFHRSPSPWRAVNKSFSSSGPGAGWMACSASLIWSSAVKRSGRCGASAVRRTLPSGPEMWGGTCTGGGGGGSPQRSS